MATAYFQCSVTQFKMHFWCLKLNGNLQATRPLFTFKELFSPQITIDIDSFGECKLIVMDDVFVFFFLFRPYSAPFITNTLCKYFAIGHLSIRTGSMLIEWVGKLLLNHYWRILMETNNDWTSIIGLYCVRFSHLEQAFSHTLFIVFFFVCENMFQNFIDNMKIKIIISIRDLPVPRHQNGSFILV